MLDNDSAKLLKFRYLDIGTTTLASEITDLESGKRIATFASKNPQASFRLVTMSWPEQDKCFFPGKKRRDAERIAKKIEHIKPNEREKDFSYIVAEKMYFEDGLRVE